MKLPFYVLACLEKLEQAGHPCYAVGGCVRDSLLGLTPQDYDLCTAATPEQMKAVFSGSRLVLAGEKHGTVGVITPEGVVEITTFRSESGYTDSRHPDRVEFLRDIRGDLARRDFTVNAMAYAPGSGLVDPFEGRKDLDGGILRAVGNPRQRFTEDPLRILRGVRFALRYRLSPEKQTMDAMISLAPLISNLSRERVFDELCKLLPLATAQDLLQYAPVLTAAIPELAPTVGFCQHSPHHAFDVYTHTAHATAAVPPEPALRWAALLHDVGKVTTFRQDENGLGHFYGHAQESAAIADRVLLTLKAPTALRQRVVFLIEHHMTVLQPQKPTLRRQLGRWGQEAMGQLIALQKADFCSKGVLGKAPPFAEIEKLITEILAEDACLQIKDLAIDGNDLMALGFSGPAIGKLLDHLLLLVQEETVPNRREALLSQAKTFLC